MIKILIWGIGGKMGRCVLNCLANNKYAIAVGGVDKFASQSDFNIPVFASSSDINIDCDVIVDFSRAEAVYDLLPYAKEHNVPVVLCTTGHNEIERDYIREMSHSIAIFQASNMSLGVNLLIDLVRKATNVLGQTFDIEVIEQHHNLKVDSPSGTALTIANAINEEMNNSLEYKYGRHDSNERRSKHEIGMHSIRGGTVVGKHEVLFLGNDEIISIKHEASSKAVFAEGAIKAAIFLASDKKPGIYDMPDLLESK